MKVIVETSARHIHASQNVLDILFGKGYNLNPKRFLSQPGQFLSSEKVEISGPKSSIKNVSILGPVREKTQVELSITDAIKLGIKPTIRESGDLFGSPGCRVIGPSGFFDLNQGVIVAKRHIHMSSFDAKKCGVKDGQIVSVKVSKKTRTLIFGDVLVRVDDNFSLAFHIDTDESNACGIIKETFGEIILENIF